LSQNQKGGFVSQEPLRHPEQSQIVNANQVMQTRASSHGSTTTNHPGQGQFQPTPGPSQPPAAGGSGGSGHGGGGSGGSGGNDGPGKPHSPLNVKTLVQYSSRVLKAYQQTFHNVKIATEKAQEAYQNKFQNLRNAADKAQQKAPPKVHGNIQQQLDDIGLSDETAYPNKAAQLLRKIPEAFADMDNVYQTRAEEKGGHPAQFE